MFEQDRVIGRLQRVVAAIPAIKVCFLSGSFGRRAADDFSDLDVAFVFADEAQREQAWAKRQETAASIMPYVTLKTFDGAQRQPYLYLVLLANGTMLELRYETKRSLLPNALDSHIRILKDDDLWAEEFERRSAGLALPRPAMTSHELQTIDDRFWIMFWDVLRLVARGNTDKPFTTYLELMYSTLPPMLRALPRTDPARQALLQAAYSSDPAQTAVHLSQLLEAYLAAREALVRTHHLQPVANQPFEREIRRLVTRLV
jgi:hypothetical protein